jgi:fumarylacetoacetate (FAA) hydrolase
MKLASLKDGRDGRLVVVSRDLGWCVDAAEIAPTLQAALDDWARCEAPLRELADRLEAGGVASQRFREHDAASPLPRAYQWVDGSAYLNHVELVRKARGAEMPASFLTDPLMYQGGSDGFLAPREPIPLVNAEFGLDLEAEVAVVTGDVPIGADREAALASVRLVMLCNDVSLRNLIPSELAKSFGFFQSKPASAFSPVAVTPDELGDAWREGRLHGQLLVALNGRPFGRAARTRALGAGSIVGSGTVSNKGDGGDPGRPIGDGGAGYSCIAEIRTVETLLAGAPKTPFLADGDVVRIEMLDAAGHSIFGAIEQQVRAVGAPRRLRVSG